MWRPYGWEPRRWTYGPASLPGHLRRVQHALLEYARNALGIPDAAHAETGSGAAEPLIAPLSGELVERSGEVAYGFAPAWEQRLAGGALQVAARDTAGEVRAMELTGHPFYILTLYQPERAGLPGRSHPIITAFVAAAR